jgi:hypothetical protein
MTIQPSGISPSSDLSSESPEASSFSYFGGRALGLPQVDDHNGWADPMIGSNRKLKIPWQVPGTSILSTEVLSTRPDWGGNTTQPTVAILVVQILVEVTPTRTL